MTSANNAEHGMHWNLGTVIGTSASTLFRHFAQLVGIALVAALPGPLFIFQFGNFGGAVILAVFINEVIIIALIYSAFQALCNKRPQMSDGITLGIKRFGNIIGLNVIAVCGIALGLTFFVVPGFILATMWAVGTPAAVIESRDAISSLRRSMTLTDGRKWQVFGALIIAGILRTLIFAFLLALLDGSENRQYVSSVVIFVTWVAYAFLQAFHACVTVTLYYFLRREKEGIDVDHVAKAFD